MEAQNFLCSNSRVPSVQNTRKSFLATISPSSTSPCVQPHKWVSCKALSYFPLRVLSRKEILCCGDGARKEAHLELDGDIRSGVRRKKLAVFVSGGGSNFRSIHEAFLHESIHGDIVVLVTNKSGTVFMRVATLRKGKK